MIVSVATGLNEGKMGIAMKKTGYIELPEHVGTGGFDHADVHPPSDRLTSRIRAMIRST